MSFLSVITENTQNTSNEELDVELYRIFQTNPQSRKLNISTQGRESLRQVELIAQLWHNSPRSLILTMFDGIQDNKYRLFRKRVAESLLKLPLANSSAAVQKIVQLSTRKPNNRCPILTVAGIILQLQRFTIQGTRSTPHQLYHASALYIQRFIQTCLLVELKFENTHLQDTDDWVGIVESGDPRTLKDIDMCETT